ncbi:hypothetical protein CUMW_248560, partial [Citrus unshiu]
MIFSKLDRATARSSPRAGPPLLRMMSRFLLLHCLILISLFIAAATANTSSTITDRDALLALKAHITHDPTNFLAKNWNTSTPVCNWTGVVCDVHSHRVTVLNISSLNLTGTIPSQLGNLSSLQSLNLSCNRLSGSIPSAIFTIYTLKYVSFRENQVSGQIPANICSNLPFLDYLSLAKNMFHGGIPSALSNCTYLQILHLSYNDFSGAVPKDIGNLSKLKELYLGRNRLQGEIPREFGNLTELEQMSLSENELQEHAVAGEQAEDMLQVLGVPTAGLEDTCQDLGGGERGVGPNLPDGIRYMETDGSGEIPLEIGNLQNLEVLDLGQNKLIGTVPAAIFNVSTLKFIELQDNSLSGSLSSITDVRLPNLEKLHLWELSFLSSLSNCKSLTLIDLSNNPLDGILPKTSIGNLSHSLKDFKMHNCNVSGGIPEEISRLTNLTTIDLGGNKLNGSIPITLSKLQKLQGLGLEDNKLEGSIPDSICRLTELYDLELGGNKLFGSIPACFSNLASLRILSLGSNELTSIPLTFWNLNDILYLNFSSNFFTAPLPLEIGNLKVLVGMDFSMNNFSGVIPTKIGGLKNLEYLFLGYNKLQGSILDSFGDLISLKSLNLSNNNLSGAIPASLEKLSYLEDLNLSFNKLEGEILMGGSFGNFSAESFEGNELLCGSPNLQVPPCKTSIHRTSWKNSLLLGIVLPLSTIFMIVARLGDEMEVAVKVFNLQCGRAFKSFDVECEIMKSIRHRNLIKVISSCSNEELNIMIDVASALEYLHFGHSAPIIHCDLKPSNVLLDDNMVAHLSDFSIAKLLTGEDQSMTQTQTFATIGYMAPEYGREGRVSANGDVYSFGIMLMETFTGKKPTDEIFNEEMTLKQWEDVHFVAKEQCVSFVFNLAMACTVESPEQRINAKEIVTKLLKIRGSLLRNVGGR